MSFENRIQMQIDEETNEYNAIFSGGLTQGDVDALVEGLPIEKENELRMILADHIDQPAVNLLPEDSGAITGAYTQEEAERWITEYKEAMSEVPEGDS